MCHFLPTRNMVAKMDAASIEETRKVSFDDLVSESMGGDDESSMDGLVTVIDDCPLQSEPLPLLPAMYLPDRSTPDLYSCFDPPQNPERMRRRPQYNTITATPDYCSIYRSYNWRRVSFEASGNKRTRDDDDNDVLTPNDRYQFRDLLRRFAHCVKRSEESRCNILRHREELVELIDFEKDAAEVLSNETRSQVLDMVRTELKRVNNGEDEGSEGTYAENTDSYWVS